MKPSIRRHRTESGDLGEGWDLTRPPYGFATEPTVTIHPTWKAAGRALAAHLGSGSGSQLTERHASGFALGLQQSGQRFLRPRWIQ